VNPAGLKIVILLSSVPKQRSKNCRTGDYGRSSLPAVRYTPDCAPISRSENFSQAHQCRRDGFDYGLETKFNGIPAEMKQNRPFFCIEDKGLCAVDSRTRRLSDYSVFGIQAAASRATRTAVSGETMRASEPRRARPSAASGSSPAASNSRVSTAW
jgi:hypothetical protein